MIIVTKKAGATIDHQFTTVENKKGLANRLWQFAYFYAFAIEHKIILINFSFSDFSEYFEGTRKNLFCSFPPVIVPFTISINWLNRMFKLSLWLKKISIRLRRRIPRLNSLFTYISITGDEHFNLDIKDNYELLIKRNIVFIEGWKIRCNRTLIRHNKEVKKYFTPSKTHIKNISRIIDPINTKYNLIIGIHIRRGDYIKYMPQSYFSFEEYALLLEKITNYFNGNKLAFIICSDEKIDVELFKQYPCYYSTGHFIEDMYILSKCNYIFGVSSTYSLWASFFGGVPLYIIDKKDFNITDDGFKIYHSL